MTRKEEQKKRRDGREKSKKREGKKRENGLRKLNSRFNVLTYRLIGCYLLV